MKTVLGSDKFVNAKMDLPLALGKTISNEIFVTDLAKMPHLLIAGHQPDRRTRLDHREVATTGYGGKSGSRSASLVLPQDS